MTPPEVHPDQPFTFGLIGKFMFSQNYNVCLLYMDCSEL